MKWISVKERLPSESGYFYVKFFWCKDPCIAEFMKNKEYKIWRHLERWVTDEVTHWMPLPEPPKEEI